MRMLASTIRTTNVERQLARLMERPPHLRDERLCGAEDTPARSGTGRVELRRFFAYEGRVVTRRQKQVLDYLRGYMREHGYGPSLEEIGRHLGVTSLATVHKHLTRLEERGAIRRRARQSRSVEVLERPGRRARRDGAAPRQGRRRQPHRARRGERRPCRCRRTCSGAARPSRSAWSATRWSTTASSTATSSWSRRAPTPRTARPSSRSCGGEATVKRLSRRRGRVHLVPANERLQPIVAREDEVVVRGVVVGLVRRYR